MVNQLVDLGFEGFRVRALRCETAVKAGTNDVSSAPAGVEQAPSTIFFYRNVAPDGAKPAPFHFTPFSIIFISSSVKP